MESGAAILERPEEAIEGKIAEAIEGKIAEATEAEEVPNVFSVTNRYLAGTAEVSDPAEDGSQVIRLGSASGGAVIEANLSPQLCAFISGKLGTTRVISEDDDDAAPSQ
jgi:hypothetical protein